MFTTFFWRDLVWLVWADMLIALIAIVAIWYLIPRLRRGRRSSGGQSQSHHHKDYVMTSTLDSRREAEDAVNSEDPMVFQNATKPLLAHTAAKSGVSDGSNGDGGD